VIKFIITLRKNTNKYLGGLWMFLGKNARKVLSKRIFIKYTSKKIGPHGPFKLTPQFLFSNLEEWGSGHNNGFQKYIELSKNKECILDVGAHVGLTILPVSLVSGVNTKIYGFEPSSENYKALQINLDLNGCTKVVIENCLVGAEENTDILFYETGDISATSSIVNNESRQFDETHKKQVSIDSYCEKNNLRPDLIKIDVEGAEINVLRGARRVMAEFKPMVFLSVHPNQIIALGGSDEALLKEIHRSGYELINIDGSAVDKFECIEYQLIAKEEH